MHPDYQHTLILHPDDRSTDELKLCYAEAVNATVVNGGISETELTELLSRPDQRIVLLGHGAHQGLANVHGFVLSNEEYAIGKRHKYYLRHNRNNIMIFCFAQDFARKHKLPGFRTGLMISELESAHRVGLTRVTEEEINFSNQLFCRLVGEKFNAPASELFRHVYNQYGNEAGKSEIIQFNHRQLYYEVPRRPGLTERPALPYRTRTLNQRSGFSVSFRS